MRAKRAHRQDEGGGIASDLGLALGLLAAVMLLMSYALPVAAAAAGPGAAITEICGEDGLRTAGTAGGGDPAGGCSCDICLCCLPGPERTGVPIPGGAGVPAPVTAAVASLPVPPADILPAAGREYRPPSRGPPSGERERMTSEISEEPPLPGASDRTMGVAPWS